jgi:uridylate kinase
VVQVISLGGSIVAPEKPDSEFIRRLHHLLTAYLDAAEQRKLIVVVGGGAAARNYQGAYRHAADNPDAEFEDRIGIAATKLNAELLAAVFAGYCSPGIISDPTGEITFSRKMLIGSGWKPGFSTDYDAVLLAERFKADTVINLSNIEKVYSGDPKKDPGARPLDHIGWKEFRDIVGEKWKPGSNLPFDPVAARKASEISLKVVFADGRKLDNLREILNDRPFFGTTIGPR